MTTWKLWSVIAATIGHSSVIFAAFVLYDYVADGIVNDVPRAIFIGTLFGLFGGAYRIRDLRDADDDAANDYRLENDSTSHP